MTRDEWAFQELDLRAAEDARFPTIPVRGMKQWKAYSDMKYHRHQRRKERGYSRKTADDMVARAAAMDGMRA